MSWLSNGVKLLLPPVYLECDVMDLNDLSGSDGGGGGRAEICPSLFDNASTQIN